MFTPELFYPRAEITAAVLDPRIRWHLAGCQVQLLTLQPAFSVLLLSCVLLLAD